MLAPINGAARWGAGTWTFHGTPCAGFATVRMGNAFSVHILRFNATDLIHFGVSPKSRYELNDGNDRASHVD